MKKILKKGKGIKGKGRVWMNRELLHPREDASRLAMIQMLIPLGLEAVEEELQAEVMRIAGVDIPETCPSIRDGAAMEVRCISGTKRCR